MSDYFSLLKQSEAKIAELEKEIETDNKNLSLQFDLLQEAGLKIADLEKKQNKLVKMLKLIQNSPFDIEGFPSAKEQAINMQSLATKALKEKNSEII
jgi:hypothetical protein